MVETILGARPEAPPSMIADVESAAMGIGYAPYKGSVTLGAASHHPNARRTSGDSALKAKSQSRVTLG